MKCQNEIGGCPTPTTCVFTERCLGSQVSLVGLPVPKLPARSSGASWTNEEDERLRHLIRVVTACLCWRSLAAVVARIALLSPGWSRNTDNDADRVYLDQGIDRDDEQP